MMGKYSAIEPTAGSVQSRPMLEKPAFYTELLRRARVAPMSSAAPTDWADWVKGLPRQSVCPDEIALTYVRDWLEIQPGRVSRDSLASYLASACFEVGTVLLSLADEDEDDPYFDGYRFDSYLQLLEAGMARGRLL